MTKVLISRGRTRVTVPLEEPDDPRMDLIAMNTMRQLTIFIAIEYAINFGSINSVHTIYTKITHNLLLGHICSANYRTTNVVQNRFRSFDHSLPKLLFYPLSNGLSIVFLR